MNDRAGDDVPHPQPKKRRPSLTFAELPLFATDDELAMALVGRARSAVWRTLVPSFEREGLPKNDPQMGGRYVPAVKAFFDRQYGLTAVTPASIAKQPRRSRERAGLLTLGMMDCPTGQIPYRRDPVGVTASCSLALRPDAH
jgi:hypothetical protein